MSGPARRLQNCPQQTALDAQSRSIRWPTTVDSPRKRPLRQLPPRWRISGCSEDGRAVLEELFLHKASSGMIARLDASCFDKCWPRPRSALGRASTEFTVTAVPCSCLCQPTSECDLHRLRNAVVDHLRWDIGCGFTRDEDDSPPTGLSSSAAGNSRLRRSPLMKFVSMMEFQSASVISSNAFTP